MHLHLLVLDGAYTFAGDRPRFHRARPPTDDELERLLDTLIRRIVRMLTRSGTLVVGPEEQATQPYLNFDQSEDDALAAPHRHLPEFQPNSNYTHQLVLWAFGSTIHAMRAAWC